MIDQLEARYAVVCADLVAQVGDSDLTVLFDAKPELRGQLRPLGRTRTCTTPARCPPTTVGRQPDQPPLTWADAEAINVSRKLAMGQNHGLRDWSGQASGGYL
jgi:hypothetical protein